MHLHPSFTFPYYTTQFQLNFIPTTHVLFILLVHAINVPVYVLINLLNRLYSQELIDLQNSIVYNFFMYGCLTSHVYLLFYKAIKKEKNAIVETTTTIHGPVGIEGATYEI